MLFPSWKLLCGFSCFASDILLCRRKIKTQERRRARPPKKKKEITNGGVLKIRVYFRKASGPESRWEVWGEAGMGGKKEV